MNSANSAFDSLCFLDDSSLMPSVYLNPAISKKKYVENEIILVLLRLRFRFLSIKKERKNKSCEKILIAKAIKRKKGKSFMILNYYNVDAHH